MCQLVQVLQQPKVCGEEDVCKAFGYKIAGMVNGVSIHLSIKLDCQALHHAVNRA